MKYHKALPACALLLIAALTPATSNAEPMTVRVTVENLAPAGGTFLTPPWVGFHDGAFDLYNQGEAIGSGMLPAGLEGLAEDGDASALSTNFAATATSGFDGMIPGPIPPGESRTMTFTVDSEMAGNRFFSYASMVIPSNDAFVANGNPMAHPIFDDAGNFIGADFTILGTSVLDAGTEVNDELPANTAFFGQMTPNTGVDQNGAVGIHTGFQTVAMGGILADDMFNSANFRAPGYQMARITVVAEGADVTTTSGARDSAIVAPGGLASSWGVNFSDETTAADGLPLSNSLGGIQVSVADSAEQQGLADLYLVSPGQINFVVPETAALGKGAISIMGGTSNRIGDIFISNVAPALITVNSMGTGTAAAQVVRATSGDVIVDPTVDDVVVGEANTETYLMLYGTGIRGHSANPVQALVNGVKVPVTYAGAQSEFPGLDQVNLGPLPSSLAGSGTVNIELFVDGAPANVVTASFQ